MSKLQGISPQVPLVYSQTDGPYELNKTLKQAIRQNLKMLILTSPGERIMIPDFGVGLYNFLFEQVNTNTFASVAQRIKEQVLFYMPSVNLVEVNFFTSDDDTSLQFNEVRVSIRYSILTIQ
jgi:phage baseplate assembly protein W